MLVGVCRHGGVAGILREASFVFLLPHVAEALEEQQAENVMLVVAGVDLAAQQISGLPEVTLKLGQGELGPGCHDLRFRSHLGHRRAAASSADGWHLGWLSGCG